MELFVTRNFRGGKTALGRPCFVCYISVHGFVGMLGIGLFADKPDERTLLGLFKGGSLELLGDQLVAFLTICLWTMIGTYLVAWFWF